MTRTAIDTPGRSLPLRGWWPVRTARTRTAMAILIGAAAAFGFGLTSADATGRAVEAAGPELVRLQRFMALLKAVMAAGTLAAILWRLGVPTPARWLAAYALAGIAMAAGPGLIWGMAHVGLGALLLHGGLLAGFVLLWRAPAVAARLATLLTARTAARR